MPYHGYFVLPRVLPVQPELLGTAVDVQCGGTVAKLCFPQHDDDSPHLMPPRNLSERDSLTPPKPWGVRYGQGPAYITTVGITIELDNPFPYGNAVPNGLLAEFEPWFDQVVEWSQARMGWAWPELPAPATWEFSVLGHSTSSADVLEPAGDPLLGVFKIAFGFRLKFVALSHGVSADTLRSAARCANGEERLTPPHRLMVSAWRALAGNDLRRAVIDAASAAEVALSSSVTNALFAMDVPGSFVDRTILAANGLTGLIDLARSLDIETAVSRNRAADKLAVVRNHAAHAGRIPDAGVAQEAVRTAGLIVASTDPLPAPQDGRYG